MALLTQPTRSVSFSDLEIKALIKKEESGDKVFEAVDGLTGAIYTLMEFGGHDSSNRAKLTGEARIMKKLDHPNLVKWHELFDIDGRIYVLLEHMDRGSVVSFDIKSESGLASVANQVLSGLSYLHLRNFPHGDIKPSNFFLNSKDQVKVLYLGEILSKIPRVFWGIGAIHDEFSWDVWNVGLSILKLYKGSSWRLRDRNFVEISKLEEVPSSSPTFREKTQKSSVKLWRFLVCCMQTDLSKRWTAQELVLHPFVKQQSSPLDRMGDPDAMEDQDMMMDVDAMVDPDAIGRIFNDKTSASISVASGVTSSHGEEHISPEKKKRDRSSFPQISGEASESTLTFSEEQISRATSSYGEEHISPEKRKRERSSFPQVSGEPSESSLISAEEQISPKKKNPKICIEDTEDMYDVGSLKDPTQTVSEVQFVLPNASDFVQRCIQHCSLFLPDCEFEKDKLVQLWMAEECIEVEATKRIEDVANLVFDTLVKEEVIIPSKFDSLYRQLKYKVNTSKSSTWSLKQGNYLRIDDGNLDGMDGEALHLTWNCKRLDRSLSETLKNYKQLRTLMVHEECGASIKQLPSGIFLDLKLLRTLDLSGTHISELPGTIGKLESLRFLDVSETPIKRLPESTDRLYFLQTLKLRGCFGLFALPRGLGRLINLRHLDLDIVGQLKSMPWGMGKLTKLQTLQAFLVGKNEGCGIRELKNMNDITGSFCISRLENVASAEEAKEAALAKKQHIEKLELRWHDHGNEDSLDTTEILEYLQPHFRLTELQITHFSGSKLPSWISNPLFTNLASITLYKCINCHILPSIGELPLLKILHITEMNNVRDINTLFCRSHDDEFRAFPALEKLTLDKMLNLEEWTGIRGGDFHCLCHISIRYCPKLSVLPSMSHFLSLQHLEVSHCVQLVSLPEGLLPGSLESLIVRDCPKLNEMFREDGGQDRFKVAQNIWIDFQQVSLD
ncbi:Mitogen-activated protein kinase kinase (MAP2K) [Handroanthus impetiginosus]|uniref:Mitogen-activated protein kinase kinase (MAP2K) n=1 Tax=Handroanthus impetiginosus TaxID=429701 RepID=A0A2G9H457_9LAMI|nr:Mitogen-activated protein kinase kinase (MAP2K) [Handroanthus impetiginosus]